MATTRPLTRWMVCMLGVVGLLFATMDVAHAGDADTPEQPAVDIHVKRALQALPDELPEAVQQAIRAYLLGMTEHMPAALALPADEEVEEEEIEEVEELEEETEEEIEVLEEDVVVVDGKKPHGVVVIKKDGKTKTLKLGTDAQGWIEIEREGAHEGLKKLHAEFAESKDAWGNAIKHFLNSDLLKDVEITIKLPDGTTHTVGGKSGKSGKPHGAHKMHKVLKDKQGTWVLHKGGKNYFASSNPAAVTFGKHMPGFAEGKGLAERVKRLEAQNKRLMHEIELMRRRFNEVMHGRHAADDRTAARAARDRAEVHAARRARDRDRAARDGRADHMPGRIEKRLERIEHLLQRMVHRAAAPHAVIGVPQTAPKRAKAVRKAKSTDAQFLLRQARERVEELMKKLERQKAELEAGK